MSEVLPKLTANMGAEPTFSVREAAALLGRSRSWLDQRDRAGQFTHVDGTLITPLRTPGGYRRFTTSTLQDIALSCYRQGWFSMDTLKFVIDDLLTTASRYTAVVSG